MKFLVIDDDICIYSLLKKQINLNWKEARVDHFNPVKQGIPHCDFKWSDYDIILLDYDIGLANFNGLDILSKLNNMDNFPIVIMITGEGNENIAVRAIQAGADDYLIKYDIITDRFYKILKDAITLRDSIKTDLQTRNDDKSCRNNTIDKSLNKNTQSHYINVPGYKCMETISNNISMTLYAIREVDNQPVVLKLQKINKDFNSKAIERFHRELNILTQLKHPNIIKIIEHGNTENYLYYSMEYIKHGDMSMLLEKGPVPVRIATDYFMQILKGIDVLHKMNIVHRDIKAKNILFRTRDNPVIADLGSAKNLADISDVTIHGEVIGTPYYMSPEQFNGKDVDCRSDIYSLGVLFYEMIVGQKPYTGENIMEIVFKQSYEEPARLPTSLGRYQGIINTMLSINKEERFQSIDEAITAIENI